MNRLGQSKSLRYRWRFSVILTAVISWVHQPSVTAFAQELVLRQEVNTIPVVINGLSAQNPFQSGFSESKPEFADIDSDGDLDLFVGSTFESVKLFRNEGTSSAAIFSPDTGISFSGSGENPTFADLENDGDLDMVVGLIDGRLWLRLNTGSPEIPEFGFSQQLQSIDVGNYSAPCFADLDNDEDFDLIVGNSSGNLFFFENIGTKHRHNFVLKPGGIDSIDVGSSSDPTLADIDNDSDFDLFVGNSDGYISFYRNTGTSVNPEFTFETEELDSIRVQSRSSPVFGDIDADGDLDLISGNSSGSVELYLNLGSNAISNFDFQTDNYAYVDFGTSTKPTFIDIDNDNDMDLFIGDREGNIIFYQNIGNRESPKLTLVTKSFESIDVGSNSSPILADIDGDNDFDLIIGNSSGNINHFNNFGNRDNPMFTPVTIIFGSISGGSNSKPSFADIDGDMDLDLFIGNGAGELVYYQNIGSKLMPSFELVTTTFADIDVINSSSPDFADIDSDGDLDLFVGDLNGRISYFRNEGTDSEPAFEIVTNKLTPRERQQNTTPSFIDIDNDGDLDLFVGETAGGIRFFRNVTTDNGQTSPITDSLALVDLYNATDGRNWTNKANWLTEPVSSWYGIVVSGGRVTEVHLGDNNLSGTLPSSIGNMDQLVVLRLFENNLNGSIPSEIGGLVKLDILNLGDNQLSGTLPPELWSLTSLKFLHLDKNEFDGALSSEIGNLVNLTDLDLFDNNFSGNIPVEIGNLTKLVKLHLGTNDFTGTIPSAIANLMNLIDLRLFENELIGAIPSQIGNLVNLQTLNFGTNKLTAPLPSELWTLTTLDFLHIDTNEIDGAIPFEIRRLVNLTDLALNNNQFTDLPDLEPLSRLIDLTIQENRFTFEDIEPNLNVPSNSFIYSPQDSIGVPVDTTGVIGTNLSLSVSVGGQNNQYQWYKDGSPISQANQSLFILGVSDFSEAGAYTCRITNTIASELALFSHPTNVSVTGASFTPITVGDIVNDGGMSAGASWADFDNDSYLDLFVANFVDQNNFVYRNNRDGTFEKVAPFNPIVSDNGGSRSGSWGDFDNDGDPDLFIANAVSTRDPQNNFLYRNDGQGLFGRITGDVVVNDGGSSFGSSWGDFNNDGYLDLFVANTNNENNSLYQNRGDRSFAKMAENDVGSIVSDGGNSSSCSWVDFDNDGDLDLYVTNFQGGNNFLYRNDWPLEFTRIDTGAIVNDGGLSFGNSWGDYDNDGDFDLFVTNKAENFLYRNNGGGSFTKIKEGDVVNEPGSSESASWADYDNDGDLDLFVANLGEHNLLYSNDGLPNHTFTKITIGSIVTDMGQSVGSAWADYDKDGDLDLFVTNLDNENNFLYLNNGNANRMINISLMGILSNASAIGARVKVKAIINGTPTWQMRDISGQTGYLSQSSLNAEFGLGDATVIDSIIVEWPNGTIQTLTNQNVTGSLVIEEPNDQMFTRITEGEIATDNSGSSGVGWADYDNDDDLDLFVANANTSNFLYQNNGDGTFSKVTSGQIAFDTKPSLGVTWGDYDNDSDPDLFVGSLGGDHDDLFYQNNGDGSFTLLSDVNIVKGDSLARGVAWADFDNDGYLDLYIADESISKNLLYHNNGNGTFAEVTEGHIVESLQRKSFGISWGDYDSDNDLDLLVCNNPLPNFLFRNDGSGEFRRVTDAKIVGEIVTDVGRTFGSSWGDYDNDGDLDLFVTGYANLNNFLYENRGVDGFHKVTSGAVVTDGGFSLGSSWGDYDNDGYLDLFVANDGQNNFLYKNNGDRSFTKITTVRIANDGGNSVGAGWADYDSDGDLDLFVANTRVNFLYQNNGNSNHWVNIRCIGTASNTSAIGAKVRVKANINGMPMWQLREISGQTGYLSQNSLNAEFGLGDATIVDSIKVEWPSGIDQFLENVSVDTFLTISESENVPPQIDHVGVLSADSGQSVRISAKLTDNISGGAATLFYRSGGTIPFVSMAMTVANDDTFEATIPSSFLTEKGTEYYLLVQNTAGSIATFPAASPETSPQVIQVRSNNLAFSSPNLAYRMISMPIDLDDSSPTAVLGDAADLSTYNDSLWRFHRYINGNNIEFPSTGNLEPGLGFWLITRGAQSLDTGPGISVTTGKNFVITLQPGWNQIGNPFAFPVNWSDVVRDASVENQLVGYQGALNEPTGYDFTRTQLVPFQGYFVNNNSANAATIEIPPRSATGTALLAKRKSPALVVEQLQSNEWILQIALQSDRFLDKDNYIGVLNSASDAWDRHDFSETPFFDNFVSLYFPHEEWETFSDRYTGDFRSLTSEGHFWDFHVKSNIPASDVVLTLAQVHNLPPEWHIVLLDRASQISVDLSEQETYSFPVGEDGIPREFRILVGKASFVETNDFNIAAIPQDFALSQNYPNPFNPETRLNYELPTTAEVRIVVYNLSGQRVKTLFEGKQSAGRYKVSWNATSENGLRVASGVYLVRLKASDFVAVRKVALVK